MKRKHLLILLTSLLGINYVSAQCTTTITADTLVCAETELILNTHSTGPGLSLAASNTAGNNQRGNMFDIVATNSVDIFSFDVSPMGNTTIEIYYKVGTWNGFANTPSAWTLIQSTPVTYTGSFVPVNLQIPITIPAGETYGFYITSNSTLTPLNYSNGTAVGNVFSSDANITFLEGGGLDYPFTQGTGTVYQPRIWNGNIHYALSNQVTEYLWSTGASTPSITETISAPTTYSVTTTIAGCPSATDEITIYTSIPTVSINGSTTICEGDSAILYGIGATSYTWDNNISDSVYFIPSSTGTTTYTVTGTDSIGCTSIATTQLTNNALPLTNAGSDLIICEGNSVTLAASGADTYSWNNGVTDGVSFTPSLSQEYVVTGMNTTGCQKIDTILVTILPQTQVIVNQIGIQLIANQADSYQWINCATNEAIAGATLQVFTPIENGSYALVVENTIGCVDTSACFIINTVGIESINNNEFNIAPNPTNGIFQIQSTSSLQNANIEIYSTLGQLIYSQIASGNQVEIDLNAHENGVYLIKIDGHQSYRIVKK